MKPDPNARGSQAVLFLGAVLLLCGCSTLLKPAPPAVENPLLAVPWNQAPDLTDDMDYDALAHSLRQSIVYLKRLPADRQFDFGTLKVDARHMILSLETFGELIATHPSDGDVQNFLETRYLLFRSAGRPSDGKVLYTGYYEPVLSGHSTPGGEFIVPVYPRPPDLVTIDPGAFDPGLKGRKPLVGRCSQHKMVPYFDRDSIQFDRVLEGSVQPLVWLKDPLDLFFLQVQGSGRVALENGRFLRLGYHASNGHPYRSIGKLLIDQGKIAREQMSMQKIRAYLNQHPDEIRAVLSHNPSYVFFRLNADGPLGSLGVKVTPGRSIALDRRIFPPAALAYMQTSKPLIDGDGKILKWTPCGRFVLHQDSGGAIRGPARADLFWGHGPYARMAAGHMQHPGRLYFLVLKPDSPA